MRYDPNDSRIPRRNMCYHILQYPMSRLIFVFFFFFPVVVVFVFDFLRLHSFTICYMSSYSNFSTTCIFFFSFYSILLLWSSRWTTVHLSYSHYNHTLSLACLLQKQKFASRAVTDVNPFFSSRRRQLSSPFIS